MTNDSNIPKENSIVEVFVLQRVDDPFGLTSKGERRGRAGQLVVNTKTEDGQHMWQCDFCGRWFATKPDGRMDGMFIGKPNVLKAKCSECFKKEARY